MAWANQGYKHLQGVWYEGAKSGTSGSSGYINFAELKVGGSYSNSPLVFEMAQRSGTQTTTLYVCFLNSESADPGLATFTFSGNDAYDYYIVKTATSTWNLWGEKSESYDSLTCVRFQKADQGSIAVTFKNGHSATVPSGATKAVPGGVMGEAAKLQTARTISLTGDVTGSASFDGSRNISISASVADNSHSHSNYLTTTGTAAAATKLATARTISLTGDVTGSTSFNGTANVSIASTVANDSHSHSNSTITSVDAGKISGTLPVSHGGTGATTLTSGAALIGNGTSAVTTRSITNMTSKGHINYNTNLMTTNTLAYWDGSYASSHASNLSYCNRGAFGTIITKGTGDYYPTTGGTITGYTTLHHTNFSSTANPSATTYGSSSLKMETSDSKRCAIFECAKRSSGEYFVTIGASVQTDSGYSPCNISFAAKTSGATQYNVSSAALFRNAIGLGNTSGALPVANGGTGTTAKGRTLLSNIGITSGTGSAPSSGTNGCIYIQYS